MCNFLIKLKLKKIKRSKKILLKEVFVLFTLNREGDAQPPILQQVRLACLARA
jgi:hypothetical protein